MKYLARKDWLILVLFFAFTLAITSFGLFAIRLDETPFEGMLGVMPVAGSLSGIGLMLFLPIHFLMVFCLNQTGELSLVLQPSYFNLMPVFVSAAYTVVIGLGLAKWNGRTKKK